MKKTGMIFTVLLMTIFAVFAQEKPKSPPATAQGKNVTVKYAQPSAKGRKIFGELVPYGQVWRTGANAATEVTFAKDGKFGGKAVKAGTYTLYTIPEEKEWTVILSKQTGQWGTDYSEAQDLLRVKAPATKSDKATEAFTIKVNDKGNNADLVMMWENASVSVPLTF